MNIDPRSSNEREPKRFVRATSKGERAIRALLGGLLTATTLAGVLTLASAAASADSNTIEGVCEPQSAHLPPTTSTTKSMLITAPVGKVIVGTCVKAGSINQGNGPEYKTYSPGVASVTISHSSGKDISHYTVTYADKPPAWTPPVYPEVPGPGECEQQMIDKFTSTYNNGAWSAWTDWGADPVWDDGRTRTGHHSGTHGVNGDRHFAYQVVGTRPITTGTCAPPPPPPCEWNPELSFDSDECIPPQPPADVAKTEWVVGEYACNDTMVTQTRTVTTTPYIYVKGAWVLDVASAKPTTETATRELSGVEFKACPTTTPPPPPAAPPAPEVASQSPAAPVAANPVVAAAPAVEAPAGGLPATGSSSWVTALIALVTLLGGTGLVRLSRRPTD